MRVRDARPPIIALLALAAAIVGCGKPENRIEPPAHVFLITVDTLRADHMGAYGYPRATAPALDRLAAGGVVFERAMAQWPKTGASLASLFLGRYPQSTGLTHRASIELPEGELTLPELFQSQGFTTLGVVSNAVLSAELGWSQGFDEYEEIWQTGDALPETDRGWKELLSARNLNARALPLIEKHRDAERLFVWLHYMDPHGPYLLVEGDNPFLGDEYYRTGTKVRAAWFPKRSWLGGQRELAWFLAQYDANVRLTDRYAGAALDELERLGLLANALVVFTSDHGESLGQHQYMAHGKLPYNTGLHVPLFFSFPGRIDAGRRVERPIELIDLFPTLRDLVAPQLVLPGLEGESLLDLLGSAPSAESEPGPEHYAFSEAGNGIAPNAHYRTVQSARWKLIHHPALPERPPIWELYDLASDPGETHNLVAENADQARRLRARLTAWMDTSDRELPPDEAENKSKETLEALRAMGYIN